MVTAAAAAKFAGSLADGFGLFSPLHRLGLQMTNVVFPNEIPTAAEAYYAARTGRLRPVAAAAIMQANGVAVGPKMREMAGIPRPNIVFEELLGDDNEAVLNGRVTLPSPGDLLTLMNRAIITEEECKATLLLQGWWDDPWRDRIIELAKNQIPSPSELVTFALREAWDPATVARFQYDAEFPAEFRYWMQRQGADGDARIKVNGRPRGDEVNWSHLYWRVHWANISPTQAYEMFQRLREGRWERYARDLPGLRGFTFSDLQQVLKVNDYPVPFRPQLAAIAYRRPRLVDIDRFYRTGSIDRDEVLQLHLDLGYSPPDAELRTAWLESEQRKREFPVPKVNPVPALLRLYTMGVASQLDTVDRLMSALSGGRFNRADQADVPERLRADYNATVRLVQRLISDADNKAAAQEAREVVAALKRQFLHGQVNESDARSTFAQAGFQSGAADRYLRSWQRILQSGRLLLSTNRIRQLVVKQILPFPEAERMLANLGWRDPEIRYLTAELARDAELEQDRIEERLARSTERREAARMRQVGRLERERRRVVRNLNAQATPAALHKYYTRGIIDRREYERELERRGYDDQAVKRITSTAEIDRQEYLARRTKARLAPPVPGVFPTGGAAPPAGRQDDQAAPPGSPPAAP